MSFRPETLLTEQQRAALLETLHGVRGRIRTWRRTSIGVRGVLLYILPSPLILTGLIALAKGEFGAAMAAVGSLGCLFLGAYLNRRGLREELLAPTRRYSRCRSLTNTWPPVWLPWVRRLPPTPWSDRVWRSV